VCIFLIKSNKEIPQLSNWLRESIESYYLGFEYLKVKILFNKSFSIF